MGLFAIVAISLACIGVYGVISYAVGQRTRELSIRIALGSTCREIIQLVLNDGMKPAILCIALGLAAALTLSGLLENVLFEVKIHDPMVFITSICMLALAAVLSIFFLPAERHSLIR
jgi:putative ABC transport system permease protein